MKRSTAVSRIIDQLDSRAISDRLRVGAGSAPRSAAQELRGSTREPPEPASVLLPLFRSDDAWRLLFIRRSRQQGDRHSGEVAFPGGRRDRGDRDAIATALREAREEVGLEALQVDVLGELGPFRTVSNYLVTPVVGTIPWPLDLIPDPSEVARVFSIPLTWLDSPVNRRIRTWPSEDHPQARDVVFFDEFDGERLWGVSARIALDFLALLSAASDPQT